MTVQSSKEPSMYRMAFPIPPSVNKLFATNFKTGRRFKTKAYQDWKNESMILVMTKPRAYFKGPVKVTYMVGRFKDKIRRDVANLEKAMSDVLVSMGILADDSQIQDIRLRWTNHVPQGTMLVTVEQWKDEDDEQISTGCISPGHS